MSLAAVPDKTVVAFRPREVNRLFSCHLCAGYLIDAHMVVECMHSFCKSCIVQNVNYQLTKKKVVTCPVCDVQLHPTDPYSCIRSDQTLQDLAFMIVPRLFHKECEKRKDYCKKNNIEFKLPKFKRKEGYIPGITMIKTMEESEHEEEEDAEDEIAAELEDDAWIQCEREECLKWHRVNNEIAEKYENENWYCELNPDKQLNRLIGATSTRPSSASMAMPLSAICRVFIKLIETARLHRIRARLIQVEHRKKRAASMILSASIDSTINSSPAEVLVKRVKK